MFLCWVRFKYAICIDFFMVKRYILSRILDEEGKFERGYSLTRSTHYGDIFIGMSIGQTLESFVRNCVVNGLTIDINDKITTISAPSIEVGGNKGKNLVLSPLKAIELADFYLSYHKARESLLSCI